ncbi:MAG: nucleoside 2-deoxyribosyltransferase [Gallionella sp.]|nr:nucleoside 2-deoxyribosyltransferase [Gallionella sp.]
MSETCPVCNSPLKEIRPIANGVDASFYSCPLCGEFVLSRSLIDTLPHKLQKHKDAAAKISHALRTMQQTNKGAELYTTTVDEILNRPLPRPKEQADLLIRWLAENVTGPGITTWIEPSTHSSIIGAKSPEGFALILRHLFDIGLVTGNLAEAMGAPGRAYATLSFDGWDYYEKLRQGGMTYRKAFMAMKFGEPDLDQLLETIFKPSAKQAGFELFRLDDQPRAGLIDDRLRVEIQASDFVIADLSHDNFGAYWEAGYAEGLGKPVIYTCEKNKFEAQKTHFDTNHHLTIIWDKDAPRDAGEKLKATIRATLPQFAKQED